jgi:hypothetical protein
VGRRALGGVVNYRLPAPPPPGTDAEGEGGGGEQLLIEAAAHQHPGPTPGSLARTKQFKRVSGYLASQRQRREAARSGGEILMS